jgi:RNA polymerase sigma-70 factor, ECF subfamily
MENTPVRAGPLTPVERVYRERSSAMWRSVLLFSGDREVASDAVAEAFAQALRREDHIQSLEAWIWRTAFLVARGMLKDRRPTSPELPEQIWEPSNRTAEVLQALQRLSRRQREVVVLHYYADLPIREVAELIGSTQAAVGVHLHRARRKLRTLLEDPND